MKRFLLFVALLSVSSGTVVTPTDNTNVLGQAAIGAGLTLSGSPIYTEGSLISSGTYTGSPVGPPDGMIITNGLAAAANVGSGLGTSSNTGAVSARARLMCLVYGPIITAKFDQTYFSFQAQIQAGYNGISISGLMETADTMSFDNAGVFINAGLSLSGAPTFGFNSGNGGSNPGDVLPASDMNTQYTARSNVRSALYCAAPGAVVTVEVAVCDAQNPLLDSALFFKAVGILAGSGPCDITSTSSSTQSSTSSTTSSPLSTPSSSSTIPTTAATSTTTSIVSTTSTLSTASPTSSSSTTPPTVTVQSTSTSSSSPLPSSSSSPTSQSSSTPPTSSIPPSRSTSPTSLPLSTSLSTSVISSTTAPTLQTTPVPAPSLGPSFLISVVVTNSNIPKRQSSPLAYLSLNANGQAQLQPDCLLAYQFTLNSDGSLQAGNLFAGVSVAEVSTPGYAPLAFSNNGFPIQRLFSLTDNIVHWSNAQFATGSASFCLLGSAIIAVFDNAPVLSCTPINLVVQDILSCPFRPASSIVPTPLTIVQPPATISGIHITVEVSITVTILFVGGLYITTTLTDCGQTITESFQDHPVTIIQGTYTTILPCQLCQLVPGNLIGTNDITVVKTVCPSCSGGQLPTPAPALLYPCSGCDAIPLPDVRIVVEDTGVCK